MNDHPSPRLRPLHVSLLTAGAVLGIGWAIWSHSSLGQAQQTLEKELTAAKLDGLPTTVEDLREITRVEASQNAGPILQQACKEYEEWKKSPSGRLFTRHEKPFISNEQLLPFQLSELQEVLHELEPIMPLLDQASLMHKVDYHRRWEDGPALAFPEYPSIRGCIQILLLDSRLKFAEGRDDLAIGQILKAAKISSLVGKEPTLISCLVQCSVQLMILNALDGAIRTHANRPGFLKQCQVVLKSLSEPIDIRNALGSELVLGRLGIGAVATVGAEKVLGAGQGVWTSALKFGPVRAQMETRYVQIIHRLYLDISKHQSAFQAMNQDTLALDHRLSRSKDWTLAFTKAYSPTFTGLVRAVSEYEARAKVMSAGVFLLQGKANGLGFPIQLPNGAGWIDPFLGMPLKYKLKGNGFVVYSVGPDLIDNDGTDRRIDRATAGQYDITFRYP